jgi:molybdopterin guanine dinucleotide-containing S/N-oxide reductase-like protein
MAESIVTMKDADHIIRTGEESVIKGIGFIASGSGDANTCVIDVKNGKVLRIRPLHFDWKYTKEDIAPWKMEARGQVFEPMMKSLAPPFSLAYKNRVYSPNRILYPMKRVDWDPEGAPGSTGPGGRNTQNRGTSKYVRISWDEALDILTSELLRVRDTYGPTAILSQSDGHGETKTVHGPHGCFNKLLSLLGGYTLQVRNADSWEGWYWGAKHVWGCEPVGQMEPTMNVIPDMVENTDLVLFWGCDAEATPWGFDGQMASRLCYWFTELGMKSIYICPDVNYACGIHADKWIPILPNTDAALQLAIAYVWITEGTYDKEYVDTHSVGFDKFANYVLGKDDGVAKTPAWAAQKCAVPSRVIKTLAREWASKRTTIAHGNGGPTIRGPYSSEPGRLEIYLLAMQGIGKPGVHQVKMLEWGRRNLRITEPMPQGLVLPVVSSVYRGSMFGIAAKQTGNTKEFNENIGQIPTAIIPKDLTHEAILNPPLKWYGTTISRSPVEDQFTQYEYPAEGCSEIHMMWTDSPCWITCWNDGNRYIKALQSPQIEFIAAQHPWMENDCRFADLVLPVSTKFEQEDIQSDCMGGQVRMIFKENQAIEPIGESMSDYELTCKVAERFGLLEAYTDGHTVEDLIRHGYENSGVKELISYEELLENEYYVVPADPEWKDYKKYPVGLSEFYEDPEKAPLTTPSGKFEFYSERLQQHFPDDPERPPSAQWVEKGETHDERTSSERAKKYPLLVMSNHPRWRVHANHDDMKWVREAPTCKITGPDGYKYEPLWINPGDAAERDIKDGDVVEIYNERGRVLAGAYVTERIMPGALSIDHGARHDPIVPGELDRGGAINTICPARTTSKNATGMVVSGFLVEVVKADLDALRRDYAEAFSRPYDQASGLSLDRVLAK